MRPFLKFHEINIPTHNGVRVRFFVCVRVQARVGQPVWSLWLLPFRLLFFKLISGICHVKEYNVKPKNVLYMALNI